MQGFGLGRVQDGAKMGPQNAFLLIPKIFKHCKKQGFGAPGCIQKTNPKIRFAFVFEKHFFSYPMVLH